ncbi:hypothetical protein CDD80_5435 [Ophiocordyceps camponoti-rufipedis]|uniref:Uncharacterized protein n=1 Tax=Ophiocordyceps camponoti-rufipedis TaxID=2004952 RepID=A0A2C5XG55_9HYPO|nr:hypothetical protein CDD80_5435 [Ophiocordyceps camponoti-rufipedis]
MTNHGIISGGCFAHHHLHLIIFIINVIVIFSSSSLLLPRGDAFPQQRDAGCPTLGLPHADQLAADANRTEPWRPDLSVSASTCLVSFAAQPAVRKDQWCLFPTAKREETCLPK